MRILFTGDFAPVGTGIKQLITLGQYETIFNGFEKHVRSHDLSVTNLECPVGKNGRPILKAGPHLLGPVQAISALQWAGFNLVTLANNHIMDYGHDRLCATLDLCKQHQIATVGAGKNIGEAQIPFWFEQDGLRVAIMNVCEQEFNIASSDSSGANPIDLIDNYYQIQEIRKVADYIILVIHGGHEYYGFPSPKSKKLYRHYIDLGVNVVVGHHPHFHTGYEKYNGGFIFYSLGNFIFEAESKKPESWYYGYALSLELTKDGITYEIIPFEQSKERAGIIVLDEKRSTIFFAKLDELNRKISDDLLLKKEWEQFVELKSKRYLSRLLPTTNKYVLAAYNKIGLPLPFSTAYKLRILNAARCLSHNELLIQSLEKSIDPK